MTGQEMMEALSAMSSSVLDREATVIFGNSMIRIGNVDVVADDEGDRWPVIQTVGDPVDAALEEKS